jgi:hypothetical protein
LLPYSFPISFICSSYHHPPLVSWQWHTGVSPSMIGTAYYLYIDVSVPLS